MGMASLDAQDLVDEYRRAVAEETRQYAVWAATTPGSADASLEEESLHRLSRTTFRLEDEIVIRLSGKMGGS